MESGIFVVIVAAAMVVTGYFSYLAREGQKKAWQHFAATYGLKFEPAIFNSYVHGQLRGRYLTLDSFSKSEGKRSRTYTRFRLASLTDRPNPILLPDSAPGKAWTSTEIDQILFTAMFYQFKGELTVRKEDRTLVYEQPGLETQPMILERLVELLSDMADNLPKLIALGGEVMPALNTLAGDRYHPLRPVVLFVMEDIARATTRQWRTQAAISLCPTCYTCCAQHELGLGWWHSLYYYGCRTCQQSREFLTGRTVAILDQAMTATLSEQEGMILINWLNYRQPFDFEGVCIVRATDELVERFAVQAGNDTDSFRRPRYAAMRCVIAPGCNLSENTLRVLDRIFGQVAVEKTLPKSSVPLEP
jgi:hypothetical protein